MIVIVIIVAPHRYRYMAPEVFRHEPYNNKVCVVIDQCVVAVQCVWWQYHTTHHNHRSHTTSSLTLPFSPSPSHPSVLTLAFSPSQVDVYSFSMIIYQLFEHQAPFYGMDPVDAARAAALQELRPEWVIFKHPKTPVQQVG